MNYTVYRVAHLLLFSSFRSVNDELYSLSCWFDNEHQRTKRKAMLQKRAKKETLAGRNTPRGVPTISQGFLFFLDGVGSGD